jgi:protein O-GlcNAc transferase
MSARWLFVPVAAGKPWNGNTVISEPLGGSEAAVAYLAQAMQRKGEEVHVVTHGPPLPEGDFAGVIYHHNQTEMEKLVNEEKWDIVVSSRWPDVLSWPWKCSGKILWLHDLPHDQVNLYCNFLVFISQYQLDAYKPNAPYHIIGDGVDWDLVKSIGNAQQRDPNKLMWVSNPDRGLPLACHIFQEIRKRWPELQLHVYGRSSVYGWTDDIEAPYLPRKEEMAGVIMHAPLSRPALLRELSTAWAVFYPTFWPETYCMATLEAQAMGTPVICSPLGALNETVKGGILTNDFLNAISQLRNQRRWEKLSYAGIEWAETQSWANQAQKWLDSVYEEPKK